METGKRLKEIITKCMEVIYDFSSYLSTEVTTKLISNVTTREKLTWTSFKKVGFLSNRELLKGRFTYLKFEENQIGDSIGDHDWALEIYDLPKETQCITLIIQGTCRIIGFLIG